MARFSGDTAARFELCARWIEVACLSAQTDYSDGTIASGLLEFPGGVIEMAYRHSNLEPTIIDTFRGMSHGLVDRCLSRLRHVFRGQLFSRMTRRDR